MSSFPSFSLQGKVIVQFGGTGLLGRSLVKSLASAGATLVVTSRNRPALEALAADAAHDSKPIEVEQVDIGDEGSLRALRDRILVTHPRIDGIVFNAVSRPMRSYDDDLARWKESMEVNATGFFATVRIFGDAMAAHGSGSIVNIGSIYNIVGSNPYLYEGTEMKTAPDYFFHKAGMLNLTRYLGSHYGPRGLRVNVVSPGGIYNPQTPQPDRFLTHYGKMTMLGRMAQAHEIGGAVIFLLSDASSYITGTNLLVDGGLTAK